MPSAEKPSGTSIFLMSVSFFGSNIDRLGWLLAKACPDFGHTATPLPPVSAISPTGASVSRS
jgi:hypothetical protein